MTISSFDDLLQAANSQAEPQLLLFVFTKAELPEDATEQEKANFEQGMGGTLTPVVCVDKSPEEISSFTALLEESKKTGQDWDVVFASSLSGRAGIAPNSDQAEQPLQMMVQAIQAGSIGSFLAFSNTGEILDIS
ncbi:ribonucleotide reductase subunit alpha [Pseudomonas sp. C27(2019)]|uniref:ribonucleotide reductase subunit alpha n=1 Tax=Pseudomonas sp. C27(2019) TaxID=2604941 RepID=UPI0012441EA5|nr:ribonucleotide reductase subunit alpha [Pseudomonas sp. C27(2019)]QEY58825.1 ribonucleotide reductase subunit alpha [Pseudomonas sp. C27(2019)]